jgi:hypothetical protein
MGCEERLERTTSISLGERRSLLRSCCEELAWGEEGGEFDMMFGVGRSKMSRWGHRIQADAMVPLEIVDSQ